MVTHLLGRAPLSTAMTTLEKEYVLRRKADSLAIDPKIAELRIEGGKLEVGKA